MAGCGQRMAIEKSSTVSLHKSQGKTYFRTAIPKDIGMMLGLKTDREKQRVKFKVVEKGKVCIEV